MTLARGLFVAMAFSVKTHNLLEFGYARREETEQRRLREQITAHLQEGILHAEEKIEGKLLVKESSELQSLKELVISLRREFDAMK